LQNLHAFGSLKFSHCSIFATFSFLNEKRENPPLVNEGTDFLYCVNPKSNAILILHPFLFMDFA
ncbi:MAG: hypothetical protein ACLTJB_06550, partial [Holdemania filiformis]